jgi:ribose-phosphate pyrophosphokinase
MKAIVFDNYLKQFKKINNYLNAEEVKFDIIKFKNGEGKIVLHDSVKGEDVIIFSDFTAPITYKYKGKKRVYSSDEYYVELRRIINALDDPKSVNVFLPLMYECRQNAINDGESKDFEMFVSDLKHFGVNRIITFEAHGSHKDIQTYSLASLFKEHKYDVVVSPDEGGRARAEAYAKELGADLYVFSKKRDLTKLVDGSNPIVEYAGEYYDFDNKRVLIVDDILDSGTTLLNAMSQIEGASIINVCVCYALFNKGLNKFKKAHKNNLFHTLYVSDLIYLKKSITRTDFVEVIDTSELVSEAIK